MFLTTELKLGNLSRVASFISIDGVNRCGAPSWLHFRFCVLAAALDEDDQQKHNSQLPRISSLFSPKLLSLYLRLKFSVGHMMVLKYRFVRKSPFPAPVDAKPVSLVVFVGKVDSPLCVLR